MNKKLSKKEQKLIKKYPFLKGLSDLHITDYRIVNGTPVYNAILHEFTPRKALAIDGDYLDVAVDGETIFVNGDNKLQVSSTAGGYQPDYSTIGLTSNNTLGVIDYISATQVGSAIDDVEQWVQDNYCLESFAVELDGRLEDVEETLPTLDTRVDALEQVTDALVDRVDQAESDITGLGTRVTQAESDIDALEQTTARALLIPVPSITQNELVGIDTTKSQTRITIGDGLQLVNNELSATGIVDVKVNGTSVVDSEGVANVSVPTQQQADWNQTDTSAVDYIKNKPTTPHLYRHEISWKSEYDTYYNFILINNKSTPYTTISEFFPAQSGDLIRGEKFEMSGPTTFTNIGLFIRATGAGLPSSYFAYFTDTTTPLTISGITAVDDTVNQIV